MSNSSDLTRLVNDSDYFRLDVDGFYGSNDSAAVIPFYVTPVDYVFEWKPSLYRAVVPVMIFFCLIAVITNLSILVSVGWIRRDLSPTLCFSVSLAVADAYASLVIGIGLLVNSLLPIGFQIPYTSLCLVLTLEGFRLAGLIVSVSHLLLLAINHYIGIIRPLHYASTMTRGKAMLCIGFMWIIPLKFFFVYFGSVNDQGFQATNCENLDFIAKSQFRYITGGLFFVPLILMFFMYCHIFIIVLRHNRGLCLFQGSRNFRHNVKAATTTLLILGTYTVGWMPAVAFYVIVCYDCIVDLNQLDQEVLVSATMISNTLIILKLTVNPIIYAARMKEISGAMKRMSSPCWTSASSSSQDGNGTGNTDLLSHSSFIRSRNDTSYTTIRMQSMGAATGRTYLGRRKDDASPILVYQKCCDANNSAANNNGVLVKSTSNGTKSKANSPPVKGDDDASLSSSYNNKNNCLLYMDESS